MLILTYKDLIVWQKSIKLVDLVYFSTAQFPKIETYALASQMRRSAVSIPSNIAEGFGRTHKKEYIQFLSIAYGSSFELETLLIIAKKHYPTINYNNQDNLLTEVQKMLITLIKNLRKTALSSISDLKTST